MLHEARSDNKKRIDKIKQLDEIIHEVDKMTADGKVTEKEISELRAKLMVLERVAAQKQQE
jgi:hypothetical protein